MLPWPVASKPNSILRRSSVTCVELVRQNIAKNFWAAKRRALGNPALKIRHAFAPPPCLPLSCVPRAGGGGRLIETSATAFDKHCQVRRQFSDRLARGSLEL